MPTPPRERSQNPAPNRPEQGEVAHPLARGLGWVSIGIGLLELGAPRLSEQLLGLDHRRNQRRVLAALGLRELAHGAGILSRESTEGLATGLWTRVAGDVVDGVLLGVAAARTHRPVRFALTAGVVGAVIVADVVAAVRLQNRVKADAQRQRRGLKGSLRARVRS